MVGDLFLSQKPSWPSAFSVQPKACGYSPQEFAVDWLFNLACSSQQFLWAMLLTWIVS